MKNVKKKNYLSLTCFHLISLFSLGKKKKNVRVRLRKSLQANFTQALNLNGELERAKWGEGDDEGNSNHL